jgi:hypothetical protein
VKEKKCQREDAFREDVRSLLEERIRELELEYKVETNIGILKDVIVLDKSHIIQFL